MATAITATGTLTKDIHRPLRAVGHYPAKDRAGGDDYDNSGEPLP